MGSIAKDPTPPPGVDISRPTVARMYDCYMGGTHNYPVDRAAVDAVVKGLPQIFDIVIEHRACLRRFVRYMCRQGVDQFIDIGSGLPSADNTHQVAQRVNPNARVVYCDIDNTAVAQGREMLRDNHSATFIQGSALDVASVLNHPETRAMIDFSRPVGVVMMGLLHFFSIEKGKEIVDYLAGALVKGSHIGLTHCTSDDVSGDSVAQTTAAYARTPTPLYFRTRAEIMRLVEGRELVEPEMVKSNEWRMEEAEAGEPVPPKTDIWYVAVVKL